MITPAAQSQACAYAHDTMRRLEQRGLTPLGYVGVKRIPGIAHTHRFTFFLIREGCYMGEFSFNHRVSRPVKGTRPVGHFGYSPAPGFTLQDLKDAVWK